MAKIGTLIDGKYEVLREIGRGGMSVVYLAMDTRLNKQWAIKEIARKANDANNEIVVSSLLAEANLMKKLDHPSLPRIVDIIEEHDTIYVVMDYIEGEPLSKILELYGAQDQDLVIEWGKQLCDVLFYLHNCEPPIIYRDMKPANVMLRPDGTVKLIDFGIAREYKRSKTADTESLGTRGYAAPEQFGGKGQTDARTDIYCFGVTLYHLVTGLNPCEPPYELYPIKQVNPNFYDGLQYLIQKCTQMNPEDRFQSCDEIRYVLDNIQEFDKSRRIRQKKRLSSFIAMVVCTIVFAILGTGMIFGAKSALKNDFRQYIEKIEDSQTYVDLQESYENVLSAESVFDNEDKLEYAAAYMKKLVDMNAKNQIDINSIPVQEINIMQLVQDDLISVSEADDGDIYANLSMEQKTNLIKLCVYQAEFNYILASSKQSNKGFSKAKESLVYLFENENNLLSTGGYDTNEITDALIGKAKNFYYSSVLYTSLTSDSVLYSSDSEESVDIAKCFNEILESVDFIESTSDIGIKRSMYISYHNMLAEQSNIKRFKDENISEEDISKVYKALYGEDYRTFRDKAIAVAGEGKDYWNLTDDQIASLVDKTKGCFSINWSDGSSGPTIQNDVLNIARYIDQVYHE